MFLVESISVGFQTSIFKLKGTIFFFLVFFGLPASLLGSHKFLTSKKGGFWLMSSAVFGFLASTP